LTKRRYKKSPITETVIDIRLNPVPGRTLDSLVPIRDEIGADYSTMKETFKIVGQFGPNQPASQQRTQTGYRFDSADGKYVFLAGTEGFTVSRLQPYEHWEPFEKEARRLWAIYRQFADPIHCIRVAVRYINRIDITPLPVELKDYFRTYPEISPDMPQMMSGMAMQILIPQKDGIVLSLIQAIVPPPKPGLASITLDLDIFKQSQTEFNSEETIWKFLNDFRGIADHTFESCLTDKTRELFEPIVE
jgi:uncharacterized protein (TIGR04255 family)